MQKAISKSATALSKLVETNKLSYMGDSSITKARVTVFKNLGIKAGFFLELMHAQDETQMISREFTGLTDQQLADVKKDYTNPYVYSIIENYNTGINNKVEENKHKTNYGANETPKTVADSVFSAIIKKYRGKVIFVDFWASWCVPCRMGIKEITPLKEELKDKDVVFLYITNTTSPIATYNNMIPDIKGEHYRVNTDEWNVLATKFNIGGIPHYAIVNKNGGIVNNDINMGNNELKKRLLEVAENQ
jgi:thiol-disulfide isomerase/thioredoxin